MYVCALSKAPIGASKRLLLHAGMAALRLLWLADNPLALSQLYRIDVLACFPEDQQLLLDGTRHSSAEHQTASLRAQVRRLPHMRSSQLSGL